jgi:hypothetical protein
MVLAAGLGACGRAEVADYCSYGAASEAQLEGLVVRLALLRSM